MAELRQAQQQVIQQERLRALGQMASGIAHDFNNALSPILGFSELLLTVPENLDDREKATRYLRTIHTAAQDAANVVSRLREFYRHREKGEFFQPVHLNRLVEQTISLTQPRWKDQAQAEGRTVDIRTDLKPVPFVAGNEAELREVLTNLIFNAVDAMPEGGTITIRTRVTGPPRQRFTGSFHHPGSQVKDQSRVQGPGSRVEDSGLRTLDSGLATGGDGSWVEVAVSDTGTGMTEEVRQRCLEPFFSTKGERGTGLGLAMVFGTVQRHEGEIDIETEPGRGTTFILRFPVMRERGGGVEGRRQEEGLSRPLRVLVVDDNPTVRELVIAYLAIDGHTVDSATSGREGLEKFRAGHYDLVLTDRAMPEMGGDQMAAAVKRLAPRKPVIMLTGFGDMMQAADENPAGVDVVLSKPVTRSKLREALAKVQ
jgi:signal transduction histidine kinase